MSRLVASRAVKAAAAAREPNLDLIKGHQPAGKKAGANDHVTGLPVAAGLAVTALGRPGAAMA